MTAIRPATEADVGAVMVLLADEGVRRWWGETARSEVVEMIGSAYVILVDGELVGWLQYDEETHYQYPSVEFDIAVAGRFTGRGIGPAALRLAIAEFVARGHHRFTIVPALANEHAIRAYEAVGFRRVGVLHRASRVRRGDPFADELMMELVIE